MLEEQDVATVSNPAYPGKGGANLLHGIPLHRILLKALRSAVGKFSTARTDQIDHDISADDLVPRLPL